MQVWVIGEDAAREELLAQGTAAGVTVLHAQQLTGILPADEFTIIDLSFDNSCGRIDSLKQLPATLVIINLVAGTLHDLPDHFVRINGWPGFLQRTVVEAACRNDHYKQQATGLFSSFNKTTEWVPDIAGFITARIVSSIINEAYFALEENVSTKADIDVAMKMGTNYPYGPFEWAEKIGLKSITALLQLLSTDEPRYEPAALLKESALI